MKTFTKEQIDSEFAELLEMSKDILTSNARLVAHLRDFKVKTNYARTPYELQLPRVYRARAESVASIEAAELEFDNIEKLTYPPEELLLKYRKDRIMVVPEI